jgi:hypothetical protein
MGFQFVGGKKKIGRTKDGEALGAWLSPEDTLEFERQTISGFPSQKRTL